MLPRAPSSEPSTFLPENAVTLSCPTIRMGMIVIVRMPQHATVSSGASVATASGGKLVPLIFGLFKKNPFVCTSEGPSIELYVARYFRVLCLVFPYNNVNPPKRHLPRPERPTSCGAKRCVEWAATGYLARCGRSWSVVYFWPIIVLSAQSRRYFHHYPSRIRSSRMR